MPRIESGQFRRAQFEERGEIGVFSPVTAAIGVQENVMGLTDGRAKFYQLYVRNDGELRFHKNILKKPGTMVHVGEINVGDKFFYMGYTYMRVEPTDNASVLGSGRLKIHAIRVP